MSGVLHLARAEFLRLRWWFPAWFLIQPFGLMAIIPSASDNGVLYAIALTQPVLTAAWAFFLGLDVWLWASPQGAERFWTTRPISLGQLLGSRLLVLAVLVLLAPLAASLPFWLSWHLDLVQIQRAVSATLLVNLGGLGAGLLVCLLNPYLAQRSNRLLHALFTVFLLYVPLQLFLVWSSGRDLLWLLPSTVRQGVLLVALCAFPLALWLLFRTRRRSLALGALVLLPLLSVPLLYLIPVRKHAFPDSPKATQVLGGLGSLRLRNGGSLRGPIELTAERADASAGPVELMLENAVLVQDDRVVPVRGHWNTVRQERGMAFNDVPVYVPGESRVRGFLYYRGERSRYEGPSLESPAGLLNPGKPVTFKGRLIVARPEFVTLRELLVSPSGEQKGGDGLHVRRVSSKGPDMIEVYSDFRPKAYNRRGTSGFRVVDAVSGERARDRRHTSYRDIPVLGVDWRSDLAGFSPPLQGVTGGAEGYRVIEYSQGSTDLGFVTIEAPIAVDFEGQAGQGALATGAGK